MISKLLTSLIPLQITPVTDRTVDGDVKKITFDNKREASIVLAGMFFLMLLFVYIMSRCFFSQIIDSLIGTSFSKSCIVSYNLNLGFLNNLKGNDSFWQVFKHIGSTDKEGTNVSAEWPKDIIADSITDKGVLIVGESTLYVNPITGRVGIGTKVPSASLDVVGAVRLSSYRGKTTRMLVVDSYGMISTQPLPDDTLVQNYSEPQTLSLSGNTLSIAQGNEVTLPIPNDSQTLSISGTTLSISGGNSVNLPSGGGNGSVTSVGTGAGLSGGPITSSGTISINTTGIDSCTGAGQNIIWDSVNSRFTCSTDDGGAVYTNSTLSGDGTVGTPLGIAQQGATGGQVLKWDGSSWTPSDDTGFTNPMTTAGDIIYGGASGSPMRLPGASTNGYVLKYDTTTNSPYWDNAGGTGTVTSIVAGPGLAGGTITTAGTISLDLANSNTWTAFQQFNAGIGATGLTASGTVTVSSLSSGGLIRAQSGTGTLELAVAGTDYQAPLSFTNGLSLSGNTVTLGGTLIQATTIANAGNNFNIIGTGNVGVGTTAPGYKLEVNGTLGVGSTAYFGSRVGVGTTAPAYTVDINGDLRVSTLAAGSTDTVVTHSSGVLQQRSIDPRVWGSSLIDGSGTTNYVSRWTDANSLGIGILYDDGTNVGIGTSSPGAFFAVGNNSQFQVNSTGAIAAATGITSSGTITFSSLGTGFVKSTSGVLSVATVGVDYQAPISVTNGLTLTGNTITLGGTLNQTTTIANGGNNLLITGSGNLGLGTTSPTYKLEVAGTFGVGSTAYFGSTVGIGTTAPEYNLDVNGNARISTLAAGSTDTVVTHSSGVLQQRAIDPRVWGATLIDGSGTANYVSRWSDANTLTIGVLFDNGTNVGVGTTAPSSLFSVGSSSQFQVNASGAVVAATGVTSSGTITFSSLGTGLVKSTSGVLAVATAGTDYQAPISATNGLTLTGNTVTLGGALSSNTAIALGGNNFVFSGLGNVGIGTTAPGYKLEVSGTFGVGSTAYFGSTVGIGTTAPGYSLDVNGDVRVSTLASGSTDNVVTHSAGVLQQRAIDSRVWGATLIDGSGTTNYVSRWTDANTLGTGVLYDNGTNVGIGNTAPASLFAVGSSSQFQVNATGAIAAATGITSSGTITFSSLGTGFVKSTSGVLSIATEGVDYQAPISATNGLTLTGNTVTLGGALSSNTAIALGGNNFVFSGLGNVGIGTTAPGYKLEVNGTFGVGSTAYFASNVGIGTTAPGYSLDVNGDVRVGTLASGATDSVITESSGVLQKRTIDARVWGSSLVDGSGTANYVSRWTDANTLGTGVLYDNGTNVGIGTTAPGALLHVVSGGTPYLQFSRTNGTLDFYVSQFGITTIRGGSASYGGSLNVNTGSDTNKGIVVRGSSGSQTSNLFEWQNSSGVGLGAITATGSLGVGTTAPSSLFSVGSSSQFQVNSTGAIAAATGITSSGTITFSDLGTGLVKSTSGVLAVATAGTDYQAPISVVNGLTLTGNTISLGGTLTQTTQIALNGNNFGFTGSGNVGVGTTAAGAKFQVVGSGTGTGIAVRVQNSVLVDKVVILDNGNVGIGTTSPNANLEVYNGNIRANGLFASNGSGQNIAQYNGTDFIYGPTGALGSNFIMAIQGEKARITSSGNFGIGTTAPAARFAVGSTSQFQVNSTGAIAAATGVTSSGTITFSDLGTGLVKSTSGVLSVATAGTDYQAPISATNGLTLTGNTVTLGGALSSNTAIALGGNNFVFSGLGNVGVGTTAPGYKLEVNGTFGVGSTAYFASNVGIGTTAPGYSLDVNGDVRVGTLASGATDNVVTQSSGVLQTRAIDSRVWGSSLVDGSGTTNYVSRWTDANTLTTGVIYDNGTNVGIGNTAPASLFAVGSSSQFQVNATGAIAAATGITSSGTITFSSLGTGFVKSTSGVLSIATVGVDYQAPISATNGLTLTGNTVTLGGALSSNTAIALGGNNFVFSGLGNIGIGTTDPTYKLDVTGTFRASSTATFSSLVGIGTTAPGYSLDVNGDVRVGTLASGATDSVITESSGVLQKRTIDSRVWGSTLTDGSGTSNYVSRWIDVNTLGTGVLYDNGTNVGIGTTTPGYAFEVTGRIGIGSTAYFASSVGIGTTNPLSLFSVGSSSQFQVNSTGAIVAATGVTSSGTITFSSLGTGLVKSTSGVLAVATAGTDYQAPISATNGLTLTGNTVTLGGTLIQTTEIATGGNNIGFTGTGNVGIGTTNPTAKFQVIAGGTGTGFALRLQNSALADKFVILDNGNVGIGTTAPATGLHVVAPAVASTAEEVARFATSDPNSSYFKIQNKSAVDNQWVPELKGAYNGNAFASLNLTADTISGGDSGTVPLMVFNSMIGGGSVSTRPLFQWQNNGTARMTLTAAGNLGIGTTVPASMFAVGSTSQFQVTSTGAIAAATGITSSGTITFSDLGTGLVKSTSGVLAVAVAGTDYQAPISASNGLTLIGNTVTLGGTLTQETTIANGGFNFLITGTGNVGIGTTAPGAKLHVSGGALAIDNNQSIQFRGSGGAYNNTIWMDTSNALNFINQASADVYFGNNGARRMTIANGGNVGIGTTAPGYKLEVNGTLGVGSTAYFASRVGIGTTAPSSLFSVGSTSQFQVNSTGAIAAATGVTSSGTITFSDLGTGLVKSTSGVLAVAVAGTDYQAPISASNGLTLTGNTVTLGGTLTGNTTIATGGNHLLITGTGNVGVGTTSSAAKFNINVGATYTNTSDTFIARSNTGIGTSVGNYSYPFEFQATNSSNAGNLVRLQTSLYRRVGNTVWNGTAFRLQYAVDNSFTDGSKAFVEIGSGDYNTSGGGYISLGTNGADRLVVTQAGNIGIGNTNPTYKLDVTGTFRATSTAYFGSAVGIGTTAPASLFAVGSSSQFQVNSTGAIAAATGITSSGTITFSSLGTGLVKSTSGVLAVATAGTDYQAPISAANGLTLTGNTVTLGGTLSEATTIANGGFNFNIIGNGNLGIGTTAPGYKLDINGTLGVGSTSYFGSAVGIGTTAPASLFAVGSSSQFQVNSTGTIAAATGITSSGSITFSSLGTGLVKSTSGALSIATAGVDYLSAISATNGITLSNNTITLGGTLTGNTAIALGGNNFTFTGTGNVGIGTTNPAERFDVVGGALKIDNDGSSPLGGCFRFDGSELQYSNDCSSYNSFSSASAGGWTDDGTTIRLTTISDNVGVGTTNALEKFEVVGNIRVDNDGTGVAGCMRFNGTDFQYSNDCSTYNNFATSAAGGWTDDGTLVRLTAGTDNVGVGTTGDIAKLGVRGAGASTGFAFRVQDVSANDKFVILDNGNVGIGTTAPGYALDVTGRIAVGSTAYFASAVGIGTTAPSALFSVGSTSQFQVNGTGAIAAATGVTSSGSITFSSLGTGLIKSTGGQLSIAQAGVDYLGAISASNGLTLTGSTVTLGGTLTQATTLTNAGFNFNIIGNGNLGVGTTAPGYKVDINGTLGVGSTAYFASNVGIGTTAPGYSLDVNGNARISTLAAGNTDTVVTHSSGVLQQRTIDTRVWGSTLVDGSGTANYVSRWTDANTLGTGVLYDNGTNVGIGTTAPEALFSVGSSSQFQVNSTGAIAAATGVTSSGTITFSSLGTGLVKSTSGVLSVATAGTDYQAPISATNGLTLTGNTVSLGGTLNQTTQIALNSNNFGFTGTGNVGIGTTSPLAKFQVIGSGTGTGFAVRVQDSTGNDRFVILDNGNIGIGTTSPTAKLNVGSGNVLIASSQIYGVGSTSRGLFGSSTYGLSLRTNAIDRLTILDSNGNVGIGTTAPAEFFSVGASSQFQVNASGAIAAATGVTSSGTITFSDLGTGLVKSTSGVLSVATSGTDYQAPISATNGLTLTGNTVTLGGALSSNTAIALGGNNFTFTGTGNVGIGTTAPGYKLEVAGTLGVGSTAYFASRVGIGTTVPTQALDVIGNINISSGSTYKINGTDVLSSTTLGSGVVTSSLTTVGALNAGSITSGFGSINTGSDDIITTGTIGSAGDTTFTGNTLTLNGQFTSSVAGVAPFVIASTTKVTNLNTDLFDGLDSTEFCLTNGTNCSSSAGGWTDGGSNVYLTTNIDNVGIGTTAPLYKLDVAGSFRASGTASFSSAVGIGTTAPTSLFSVGSSSQFQVNSTGAIAAATGVTSSGTITFSSLGTGLVKSTSGVLSVATAGTDYQAPISVTNGLTLTGNTISLGGTLTGATTIANGGFNFLITGTGNVGIGTTNPTYKLDVTGTFRASSTATFSSLVGIGTTAPAYSLDVNGDARVSTLAAGNTDTVVTHSSGVLQQRTIDSRVWGSSLVDGSGTANYVSRWTDANTLGTGVLYDNGTNVGIGTTAPSALFSVGASSQFQVNASGAIAAATGITSSGTITFSSLGTGLVKSTSGVLSVATAGTDYQAPISATNGLTLTGNTVTLGGTLTQTTGIALNGNNFGFTGTGNVGIGTTAAGAKFQVIGAGTGTGFAVRVQNSTLADKFVILDNGNVGIGTTAPGAALHITSSTGITLGLHGSTASKITLASGDTNDTDPTVEGSANGDIVLKSPSGWNYFDSNNHVFRSAAGAEWARIQNGNIGIGTTAPAAALSVGSSSQFQVNSLGAIAAATGITSSGSITFSSLGTGFVKSTAGALSIATAGVDYQAPISATNGLTLTGNTISLGGTLTGNTTIANGGFNFNITGTGNVGVGTTAPGYKLDVNGTFRASSTATFSSLVGIGTTAPGYSLDVNGDVRVGTLASGATDSVVTESSGVLQKRTIDTRVWGSTLVDGSGTANYVSRWTDANTLGTGVLYDNGTNVGIGNTAPASLFAVGSSSQFQVNATGAIAAATGITSSGTITFSSLGSGLVKSTSGVLSVATAGTDYQAPISATNGLTLTGNTVTLGGTLSSNTAIALGGNNFTFTGTGNVGIGTTDPTYKLDVTGTFRASSTATFSSLVGIGTTAPAYSLDVNGDARISTLASGATDSVITESSGVLQKRTIDSRVWGSTLVDGSGTANYVSRWTDANTLGIGVLYDNGTNVGIGTTAPAAALSVGSSSQFQVNSTGAIAAATGITSSGTITFSSLGTGFVKSTSGVLSVATAGVDYQAPISATNGLTLTGNTVTLGGTLTQATSIATAGNNFVISGTGNLGIGGTAALGKLFVQGSGNSTGFTFRSQDSAGVDRVVILDNGNVGIGTTAPGAALAVGSGFTVNSTGAISTATGITSSGSITFSSLGTGLVKSTSGALSIATAGTDYQAPISASNGLTLTGNTVTLGGTLTGATTIANGGFNFNITGTGNVGIGTTSPTYKLDVTGTFRASSTAVFSSVLGIGTTAPAYSLDVNGDVRVGTLASGATDSVITESSGVLQKRTIDSRVWGSSLVDGSGTANYVSRWTDANTLGTGVLYDNGTNVGIGTTAPAAALSVGSSSQFQVNSSGAIAAATGVTSSGTITFSSLGTGLVKSTSGVLSVATAGTDYQAPISATNGLTLTGNTVTLGGTLTQTTGIALGGNNFGFTGTGNIGIGTTTPSAKFHISTTYSGTVAAEQYGQLLGTSYATADTGTKQGIRVNTAATHTSGTMSSIIGMMSLSSSSGSGGSTTNVSAFWGRVDAAAGASITNAYGVQLADGTNSGTISNQYGIYVANLAAATNNWAIYTSGTTRSYFGGNIGIGTTAPSAPLSVGSSSQFQVNSSGAIAAATGITSSGSITFSSLGTGLVKSTAGALSIASAGTDYQAPISATNGLTLTGNTISLGGTLTGNTTIANGGFNFMITGTGNVGIGTTNPVAKFAINTGATYTNNSDTLIVRSNTGIGTSAGNYSYPFEFQATTTASTGNIMRLQSSLYRRVTGTAWQGAAYRLQYAVDNSFTDGSKAYIEIGAGDLTTTGGGYLSLGTNGVDRLVVAHSGNVGIGNTGAIVGKLSISSSQYQLSLLDSDSSDTSATGGTLFNSNSGLFTIQGVNSAFSGSAIRLAINQSTGNVGIGTTAPGYTFDVNGTLGVGSTAYFASRVGIGTTNPTSLFSVGSTSQFQVNSTGAIAAATGVTSSGTITFSDLGTGLVKSTSGVLSVATAGVDYLSAISATNGLTLTGSTISLGGTLTQATTIANGGFNFNITGTGNLGIGTTNPQMKLHVQGTGGGLPATSGTTQSNGLMRIQGVNNPVLDIGMDSIGSGAVWFQVTSAASLDSSYSLLFNPNGGNVGIGTTSPDALFTVGGIGGFQFKVNDGGAIAAATGITSSGSITFSSLGTGFVKSTAGALSIATAGVDYQAPISATNGLTLTGNTISLGGTLNQTTQIALNSNNFGFTGTGNVGIGTTSPLAKFQVIGSGTGTGFAVRVQDSTGTDRFVILDNGNLGIGTTSPASKLEVAGDLKFTAGANRTITGPTGTGEEFNINAGGTNVLDLNNGSGGSIRAFVDSGTGTALEVRIFDYAASSNDYLSIAHSGSYAYLNTSSNADPLVLQSAGGNVGIGGTAPGSLFSVGSTSQFQVNSSGAIAAATGVTSSGSITFSSLGTGLVKSTAGVLSIASAGTDYQAPISATNGLTLTGNTISLGGTLTANTSIATGGFNFNITGTGNLGVGTTSATAKLDILGANTGTGFAVRVRDGGATPTDRFVILDNGNVGIGTTAPGAALAIGSGFTVNSSGAISAATGITSSGSVAFTGIGTTFGSHVCRTSSGQIVVCSMTTVTGSGTSGFIPLWNSSTALTDSVVYSDGLNLAIGAGFTTPTASVHIVSLGAAPNAFRVDDGGDGDTSPFVIDNNGNVGINNETPDYALEVGSADYIVGRFHSSNALGSRLYISATASGGRNYSIGSAASGDEGAGNFFIRDETGSAIRLAINSSGNLGVGTTAPSSLFSVGSTSQFQVNSTGAITAATGITSSGSITFSSLGTGLLKSTAGALSVATAGTDYQAPISATNGLTLTGNTVSLGGTLTGNTTIANGGFNFNITGTGNLGIGTTNPTSFITLGQGADRTIKLEDRLGGSSGSGYNLSILGSGASGNGVGGSITLTPGSAAGSNGASGGDLNLNGGAGSGTAGGGNIRIQAGSGIGGGNVYINAGGASGHILLGTSLGNIGIGSTGVGGVSPIAKLQVIGAGTGTGFTMRLRDSTGTDRFVVLDNGNVGIGTTTPLAALDIRKSNSGMLIWSDSNSAHASLGIGRTSTEGTLGIASGTGEFSSVAKAGDMILRSTTLDLILAARNTTGDIHFTTGATDTIKMTVDSSGNVGIGTTTPSGLLEVGGTTSRNNAINVSTIFTSTVSNRGVLIAPSQTSTFGGSEVFTGFHVAPSFKGTGGTQNFMSGLVLMPVIDSTATSDINTVYGGYSRVDNNSTSTNITNLYNFFAANSFNSGTITNNFGLYIENQTAGINNFAIYSVGGTNYFGGNIGIGTTAPAYALDIAGKIGVGSTAYFASALGIGTSAPDALVNIASTVAIDLFKVEDNGPGDGTPFVISASGNVSIGATATPANIKLDVEGRVQLDIGNTATFALCHVNNGIQADQEVRDCSPTATADYMEMYPVDEGIEMGDLVGPSSSLITTDEGDQVAKLTKTTQPYQQNVIGVVSDKGKAGDFNSIGHNIKAEDNPEPIALNGRVPVKISAASQNIQVGDFITTSADPGKGMKATKAGVMVGRALEPWTSSSGKKTVMVFITNTYADPERIIDRLALDGGGNIKLANYDDSISSINSSLSNQSTQLSSLSTDILGISTFTASQSAIINDLNDEITSVKINVASLSAQLDGFNNDVENMEIASLSAEMDSLRVRIEELENGEGGDVLGADTEDGTFGNLTVTGKTNLYDLAVTGSMSAGLISIDGMSGEINTLTNALKIQSAGLGSVEMMGGKVNIDQKGNVYLNTGKIVGNDQFRGKIILPAGQNSVRVHKEWETTPFSINVTSSYNTKIWVEDMDTTGFTVYVDTTALSDKEIYWVALW